MISICIQIILNLPDPCNGVIHFNGDKICLLHDPMHLFKCQRNLLLSYMVELNFKGADREQFVKWSHYESAFDMDKNSGICDRHIPKITQTHIRKNKIKRMNVLHCSQVFSRSMAKWLQTCVLIGSKYEC